MFGLKIGGRTAMQVRREVNNAAAANLRNPTKENRQKLEALRKEYNNISKQKKKK
jgi:hypothetical protein